MLGRIEVFHLNSLQFIIIQAINFVLDLWIELICFYRSHFHISWNKLGSKTLSLGVGKRVIFYLWLRALQNTGFIVTQWRSKNFKLDKSNLVKNILSTTMILAEDDFQILNSRVDMNNFQLPSRVIGLRVITNRKMSNLLVIHISSHQILSLCRWCISI